MTEIMRLRPYVNPILPENWKWKPASAMPKYTPSNPLISATPMVLTELMTHSLARAEKLRLASFVTNTDKNSGKTNHGGE